MPKLPEGMYGIESLRMDYMRQVDPGLASRVQIVNDFIHAIYPVLKEHLFQPLGFTPPDLPLTIVPWNEDLIQTSGGATAFMTPTDNNPIAIWINPVGNATPLDAAAALAHEMIHSIYGDRENGGHTERFGELHHRIGLIGRITQSVPGPQFVNWYKQYGSPVFRNLYNKEKVAA